MVIRFSRMMNYEKILYSLYYPFFVIIKEELLISKKKIGKVDHVLPKGDQPVFSPSTPPVMHAFCFLIKITLFQSPKIYSQ